MSNIGDSVVIISNSVGGGGAENAMREVFFSFSGKFPCYLVALNRDKTAINTEGDIIVLERKWGGGLSNTFSTLISLEKTLKNINPGTLIVNCELAELLIAFSRYTQCRIICVEHTTNPWAGRRLLGFIVRKILSFKKADWVTVSSNTTIVWKSEKLAKHIPNPVPVPQLGNPRREMNSIYIGRLNQGKRPEWALSASNKAKVTLQVFGEGPLLNDLMAMQLRLNYSTTFHGYVEDCWKSISKEDVLLMPSAFEGDGIVVVQAILAGIRILLADNLDLRRFQLPEECYCSSEEEMTTKLIEVKYSDLGNFRASDEIRNQLMKLRSPQSVSEEWIRYLRKS